MREIRLKTIGKEKRPNRRSKDIGYVYIFSSNKMGEEEGPRVWGARKVKNLATIFFGENPKFFKI